MATEAADAKSKEGAKKPDRETGAQAPGKPTAEDGYIPPKKWDGKKVYSPKGFGWPDKDGNVWVPTGPKGHGGPHWDVQKAKGGYLMFYLVEKYEEKNEKQGNSTDL